MLNQQNLKVIELVDELKIINNKYNQKIQELNKQLEENEEYFNDYEKSS